MPAARTASSSFDKTTGRTNWVSAPEGRPTDTIYANPFIADVNGVRTFFSGGSDGAMHAIKINTGEPIWNWSVSQRGLNTAALGIGNDMIVTHSEENVGTSEMGMVAAVPTASKGTLTDKDARWLTRGVQAGYASPVSDGERLYLLDNGGVLIAVDLKTGKTVWTRGLGTIAEGLAGLCRRQAVHRHREHRRRRRQVLHHQADRREGGDPRPGLARHAAEIRTDHRGADRRARPRLRDLDGRALCDRAEGSPAGLARQRRRPVAGETDGAAGTAPATALVHPDRIDPQAGRVGRPRREDCSTPTAIRIGGRRPTRRGRSRT